MSAYQAGCRSIEISDLRSWEAIPTLVLYPSHSAERPERVGPYTLSVAMNGEAAGGRFPVVVISHGTGGSPLVYRTLGEYLARHGFVVLLPEHPRNNRNNNELAGTAAILTNRPRHLRLVLDWAYADGELGACVEPDAVTIIGHSLGGYTALAAAGGVPTAFAHETPDGVARLIEVTPDARVRALVLLAPATAWFLAPGALDVVRVPMLVLTAEKDPHTPKEQTEFVLGGLPEQALLEYRTVTNAGHFSFLSPFPAAMTTPAFAPSQDPEGFDRERFHGEMNAWILAFLDRVVRKGGAS